MKFPNYGPGAQGALLQANALDADRLRPYAEQRDGDQVIQRKDMHLYVERDEEEASLPERLPPFFLSASLGDTARRHLRLPHDLGAEGIQAAAQVFFPGQWAERDITYVGGGYVLCLMYNTPSAQVWPMLWHVDNLDGAPLHAGDPAITKVSNVMFHDQVNRVGYLPAGESGEIVPSVFAAGKDGQGRYWFGMLALDYQQTAAQGRAMYACYVGNTVGKTLSRVWLPHPPRHADLPPGEQASWRWVASDAITTAGLELHNFSPKVQCVGPGHLLVLLVPKDPVEDLTRADFGVAMPPTPAQAQAAVGGPQKRYVTTGFGRPLPLGSAPCLLRSRDFGRHWSIEKAQFLNPAPSSHGGTLSVQGKYPEDPESSWQFDFSDGEVYDGETFHYRIPSVPCLGFSYWAATQMGGGRVALWYPKKRAGESRDLTEPSRNTPYPRRVAMGLWLSDARGENFQPAAWPGDAMYLSHGGTFSSTVEVGSAYRSPVFTPWLTTRPRSAGPGSLFVEVATRHPWLTVPAADRIRFPAGHERSMLFTLDGGANWAEQPVPNAARSWGATWQLLPGGADGAPGPEMQFVVAEPARSRPPTAPAQLWLATYEQTGVYLWRTDARFAAWELQSAWEGSAYAGPSSLFVNGAQLLFVGDDNLSGEYLSQLHAGYAEMGEEK